MPKVHQLKARKDYPGHNIAKGDTYYRWKFRNGPEMRSKTYPKASQLTMSPYKQALYEIQDDIAHCRDRFNEPSDVQDYVDDLRSRLEELRDEQEEKKSNMPDQLQESSAAEILQERYDTLDEAINELDSLDLDYLDPDDLPNDDSNSILENAYLDNWLDEKAEEIQNITLE